jgi:SAM-dependent methyltransferase
MSGGSAMDVEFDDLAGWTADAVEQLGLDHAIPAGCRGSASPTTLAWLAEACRLSSGTRLLDLGAGVGGPAAWATRRYGVRPVLVDPMPGACRAAGRLFGLPAVLADGLAVPLRSRSFDAAWSLGVLCTVDEKYELLRELHRLLIARGPLGLLVLVAQAANPQPAPEGNSFPSQEELVAVLEKAQFEVVEQIAAPEDVPSSWTERADRVDQVIREVHGDDPRFEEAEEQSRRMSELFRTGQVSTQLVHAQSR